VWIAYVQFLTIRKRGDEAQQLLEQARSRLPADKADLTLAQCNEILGKQEEAGKLFERALSARPNDLVVMRAAAQFYLSTGRVLDADPLLRRLHDGGVAGASPADREWARHGLALVLATGTDYRRFREALRLEGLELDRTGQLVHTLGQDQSTERQKSQARV